jgi:hypothetical protein
MTGRLDVLGVWDAAQHFDAVGNVPQGRADFRIARCFSRRVQNRTTLKSSDECLTAMRPQSIDNTPPTD